MDINSDAFVTEPEAPSEYVAFSKAGNLDLSIQGGVIARRSGGISLSWSHESCNSTLRMSPAQARALAAHLLAAADRYEAMHGGAV